MKKVLMASLLAVATSISGVAAADEYAQRDEVQAFIGDMVEKHQMDRTYLTSLFSQAQRQQSIIDAISRPAEKTLQWFEYRKIFIQESRIEKGKAFLKKYASTFDRVEAEYGVPREIVAAIIGVETRYGGYMGNYRVLDSLATLGFDYPARGKFFRGQLEEFLLLVREQNFDATELKGSYAGAMGFGQFIPSSYRAYAVDFDGDNIVDIWSNPVDAIGSVANYFARHGWRSGEPVVLPAQVDETYDDALVDDSRKAQHSLAKLANAGIKPAAESGLPAQQAAMAMRMQAEKGPEYWIGLENFYVITRYNHSKMYALAVYQLSQALKA